MSSETLQHTPLYQSHLNVGAKMVDFGGWSMPISYGSQVEEHHHVRQTAGMFDVSHMLNIDIQGPDSLTFLRVLLANDVQKIVGSIGKALYTCMLNPEGGVIDDLIVYSLAQDSWRLVVNAGCASKDLNWIKAQAKTQNAQVEINPRYDLAMIAVQGPQARELVWKARPQWQSANELKPFNAQAFDQDVLIARTGYTGEDGLEITVPTHEVVQLWDDLLDQEIKPCGLGARDTLRLEAGLNLYGSDMDETILPTQAGLAWTLDTQDTSRQFIGAEALKNTSIKNTFLGLKLNQRGVMRAQMKVKVALGEGIVTSGTMSPTIGVSIGLARLPQGTQVGDSAEVEIRGKWAPATVVALPFVRHGKVLLK